MDFRLFDGISKDHNSVSPSWRPVINQFKSMCLPLGVERNYALDIADYLADNAFTQSENGHVQTAY